MAVSSVRHSSNKEKYDAAFSTLLERAADEDIGSGTRQRDRVVDLLLDAVAQAASHTDDRPHRRLFFTREGRFGLGPPDCRSGDIVARVYSFCMPTVLRPCEGAHDEYEYVGNAYVHSMMGDEVDRSPPPGPSNWIRIGGGLLSPACPDFLASRLSDPTATLGIISTSETR